MRLSTYCLFYTSHSCVCVSANMIIHWTHLNWTSLSRVPPFFWEFQINWLQRVRFFVCVCVCVPITIFVTPFRQTWGSLSLDISLVCLCVELAFRDIDISANDAQHNIFWEMPRDNNDTNEPRNDNDDNERWWWWLPTTAMKQHSANWLRRHDFIIRYLSCVTFGL